MPVNEKLMELGSWSIELIDETPKADVLDRLGYFGHIAFVPGRLNPAEYGDQLLDMARYVGVVTGKSVDHIRKVISGQSMNLWLADSDGKGDLLETAVTITGLTFANAIRAILGSGTAVVEGTLYSGIPGVHSGTYVYQSRRKAIDFICTTMGGEWRVNGRGELDAGPATSMYNATPDTVIVRRRPNRHTDGDDLTLHGLRGDMGVASDIKDWTSRVVLLAEGQGTAIATATADNPANPYLDIRGNPVKRVRVISESTTAPGNAEARAEYQLARFVEPRSALTMTTDDYDVTGAFAVGDWAYVYAPDEGLVDPGVEITFRGERLNPVKLRMVGASWPVRRGMTVAYRAQDGSWLDLTPYVDWEGGETTVTVGDLLRALSDGSVEPVGPRPIPDSTIPGVVAWDLPFESGVYLGSDGSTRAKMLVKWDLPLNVDGSTILDGDHYEIQYGVSPAGTEWQTGYAPWGTLQAMINDLTPGIDYDFRIRAVDSSGNQGAWSTTQTEQTNADTIAPSTPAAPTVAASLIAIQITHQLGKASGGLWNLELDLDHLEVHVGATSGFTPDSTTLRGKVAANAGMIQAQIAAVGTVPESNTTLRQVRVIAVDVAGNRSSPSAAASVTANLIDDAHITDLTVSKVTAGTISTNWLIGASIRTASSGQRVELNASGMQMYNSGGTLLVSLAPTGTFFMRSATTGARIDLSNVTGLQLYDAGSVRTVWLDLDGSFELRSAASGARINLDGTGFRAYNSGGVETVSLLSTGAFTLRSAASGSRIEMDGTGFRAYDSGANQTVSIDTSGTVAIIGDFKSGTTGGPRVEIGRRLTSVQAPWIRLYTPSGLITQIQSSDASGGPVVDINNFDGCGLGLWRNGTVLQNTNGPLNLVGVPVQINGTTKTFVIDHPLDDGRWLVHATTESPHNGTEYWGSVTLDDLGVAEVALPAYFEALNAVEGRAVLLTGLGDALMPPTATYPAGGRFEVHGVPGQTVSWLVKAIRKDVPPLSVEPRRDDATLRGDGPYRYLTPKESQRG